MKRHVLGLVLALLTFSACGGGAPQAQVTIGSPLPEFSLESLTGGELDSSALNGDIVVVNFWATWCQPCLKEIPVFKELTEQSAAQVVGIALDEQGRQAVEPFVRRHDINYTVLLGDQEIFERFNGFSIPYTLVVDRSRQIVNIYRGPFTRENFDSDLRRIERGA